MSRFIWQQPNWPRFTWQSQELEDALARSAFTQGRFLGSLSGIGLNLQNHAGFETLSEEILSSAAIEGETLNRADVRSSVARRMEIVLKDSPRRESHELDARVEMMLDATRGYEKPMTESRLMAWHAALFPTGYSGLSKLRVAAYRDDAEGPMQVVSRQGSLLRVHFEAPPASQLPSEMRDLLSWLNVQDSIPLLVKVALAHLHFLTLHPFEDGNGRLARALTEWGLARGEQSQLRFYSLSAQIQTEKDDYYAEIEHAQRNSLDVTRWILWFLGCHARAIASAEERLAMILAKAKFWSRHASDDFNEHQREMLNRLLDGFDGNLTSSKWAKICKVSQDTANREITPLVAAGVLHREGSGRSTHYVMQRVYDLGKAAGERSAASVKEFLK